MLEITGLLRAWGAGDDRALEQLTPIVYSELRRLARHYMQGEAPGHTLQATALVHEAFLKLLDSRRVQWQDRTHFLSLSAQLMRRILVDFARSRKYLKRGGAVKRVALDEVVQSAVIPGVDLVALDEALQELERKDKRKSRVIELRFFGGLTVDETAHVLDVSSDTVIRDWRLAKAMLLREMRSGGAYGS